MNDAELYQALMRTLDTGYDHWSQIMEDLSQGASDVARASDIATALSVSAGMLGEYLGYRGGFGTGDHGHEAAIKAALKHKKKLRKANGYTYP